MSKLEATFRQFLCLELQQYCVLLADAVPQHRDAVPAMEQIDFTEEFPARQLEGIGLSWALEVAVCALGKRIARCGGAKAFESFCSIDMEGDFLKFVWRGYVYELAPRPD